jgi:hypothetical protein
MGVNCNCNTLAIDAVKGSEHFVLVYPNTPTGRLAAKQAVRTWLLDLELDFNRQDAQQLWRAIDTSRFNERLSRGAQRGVRWNWRGRART